MFPETVYHCQCVSLQIKLCLVNGQYCLTDIVEKLKEKCHSEIYYCKCGNNHQNVVFSCRNHMSLVCLCKKSNQQCEPCMKSYLKAAYRLYDKTNFDLPLSIKKKKKYCGHLLKNYKH